MPRIVRVVLIFFARRGGVEIKVPVFKKKNVIHVPVQIHSGCKSNRSTRRKQRRTETSAKNEHFSLVVSQDKRVFTKYCVGKRHAGESQRIIGTKI